MRMNLLLGRWVELRSDWRRLHQERQSCLTTPSRRATLAGVSREAGDSRDLDDYCSANRQRFLDELVEFCRIPSVSAGPPHAPDPPRTAGHPPLAAPPKRA